jgi:hypothetical protein
MIIHYKHKLYTFTQFCALARLKFWNSIRRLTYNQKFYPFFYKSTWHALIHPSKENVSNPLCYYTAIPNPGAGIGHQLANWIAGVWYAKQFGVPFAHTPFSNEKWEYFLGFREQLPLESNLILKQGYKKRTLPLFLCNSAAGLSLNHKIVLSYAKKKVLLVAEQDQHYREQFGIIPELREYFEKASARKEDRLLYDPGYFNIAVHVRRIVIIDSKEIIEDEENRKKRWLADDYYLKIIQSLLEAVRFPKPARFYIFSTKELSEFQHLGVGAEVVSCHEWDEYTSFLHLIRADLLVTSKSSFSYKAALISEGYKISPRHFWHGYPEDPKWILAENDGSFDTASLNIS